MVFCCPKSKNRYNIHCLAWFHYNVEQRKDGCCQPSFLHFSEKVQRRLWPCYVGHSNLLPILALFAYPAEKMCQRQ
jgi:hypothetical protein